MIAFFTAGIGLYLIIFVAKVTEVTLAILRTIMITKGERIAGSIIGFFEVLIWVALVSTVLTNIAADPYKIVAFALGFSAGNYLGSVIESKIGLGTTTITVIVGQDKGPELARYLQEKNLGTTLMNGSGKEETTKNILMLVVKRKHAPEIIELIKNYDHTAFITIAETKPVYGGYGLRK
ncbi:DUF2179 domain-containing protein [Cellulosilyticum sp. I15G10I2]|uniref:DUF2179 domain-containing protein n=1 Tax=Cellulosilyticum sp. I15G10I2 TaxID=1892843 RepID=UPI00085C4266|nr:DUF5698 domain-containing protein [Cellulosilyticum sp. I15G10I2]